jgi:peptide/nickel transport system permease protein
MAAGTFTEYTQMITIDALLNGDIPLFLDAMAHLILPVGVLVFTQCAALIRVTRSSLIEESGKWYIVSAMSKGLSKKEAMYKHARRNASVSVLTLTGLLLANMFVGLVIVETVFRRPGFAYLVASASRVQDTPVVFACATLIALFYVLVNLAIDVSYEYIDPRIRLG